MVTAISIIIVKIGSTLANVLHSKKIARIWIREANVFYVQFIKFKCRCAVKPRRPDATASAPFFVSLRSLLEVDEGIKNFIFGIAGGPDKVCPHGRRGGQQSNNEQTQHRQSPVYVLVLM